MAKQKGIVKIQGTIGDLSFLKTKDGYEVRGKSGVDASRIAKDPAFKRTRENGEEFGRAGKSGKVLRTALRPHIRGKGDSRLISRLVQTMMQIIKTDSVNARGKRTVTGGNKTLLQGFEINGDSRLASVFTAPYAATISRAGGSASIAVPSFVPELMIAAPAGTTHFKLKVILADVDFATEKFNNPVTESANLQWNNTATAPLNMELSFPASSQNPLFLVLGVEFFQDVNGAPYALLEGRMNAMAIIQVDEAP